MGLIGYARTSTGKQDLALQLDALDRAGCERNFKDTASGSLNVRPQLDNCLHHLRQGDTLVVWKLDRLGRSLRHLIETVARLEERGIGFRCLTEGIDTTTPAGRLTFHIFGALAEFEGQLIRERTLAGLEAARARDRRGGRPASLTPEKARCGAVDARAEAHDEPDRSSTRRQPSHPLSPPRARRPDRAGRVGRVSNRTPR